MADFRFPKRIDALRAAIADESVDALIISDTHNRRYLSGFVGTAGYLVITRTEAVIATDFRYLEQAESQAAGFNLHRVHGPIGKWFPPLLDDLGICTLGFEADDLTVSALQIFNDALRDACVEVELKPRRGDTAKLRTVKDEEEMMLLQRAIDIGDAAFEETAAKMAPGMTEKEVAWEFEKTIREMGAESLSFETIVASGPNAARPHHQTGDRELREGETIVFDCGAKFDGYCSDLTRTVVLGELDDEIRRVYGIVLDAQEMAIDKVQDGMTGKDADEIAREVIAEAGHGDEFGHSLGHGLGLQVHEEPNVGPRGEMELLNGMAFTIEPGIYIPGWGGVRIEDVAVLENGRARILSQAEKLSFD